MIVLLADLEGPEQHQKPFALLVHRQLPVAKVQGTVDLPQFAPPPLTPRYFRSSWLSDCFEAQGVFDYG